jgi:hypothetical protein
MPSTQVSAKEHQSHILYHRAFALPAGRSAGFDAPLSHVVNETFLLGLCVGNLLGRRGTTRKKTCGSQRHCGSLDARHGFPFAFGFSFTRLSDIQSMSARAVTAFAERFNSVPIKVRPDIAFAPHAARVIGAVQRD